MTSPVRFALAAALVLRATSPVHGQDSPADAGAAASTTASRAPGTTTFLVENVTRAELWRYFTPPPGAGREPNYGFAGNRSTLGVAYDGARWTLDGAIQYVRIENLPRGAIGPGLLGTGAAYYFQAVGTFSYQFYLRGLSFGVKDLAPGLRLRAGRFSMGHESPDDAEAPVTALAAERLDGRLLGDMPWSFYQRAWDGVQTSLKRRRWAATVTGAQPTQGTFEESANLTLDRLHVVSADVVAAPGALVPHTMVRVFGIAYDDRRQVRARPDNSGVSATGADVRIATYGLEAAGSYPVGGGRWDAVLWSAGQIGDWYGEAHRAASAAAEGGYEWSSRAWRPRLRAGAVYASGDDDGEDRRHRTFFAMLPSGDRYVGSNAYALMNVWDTWAQASIEPASSLALSTAVHHVALAQGADRWYSGSGATERRGNYFGFLTRNTHGATALGTIAEATVRWHPVKWWTLRAYGARMWGGDAVRGVFSGDRLTTAWLESTVSF